MYLLDVHSRKLKYFAGEVPLYAILSHTWGDDEITFQDIGTSGVEQRTGYAKVNNTCEVASAHGFNYVWIDTCCIDKKSSAELSEAINSMYRWYRDAAVCYAYLSDVPANEATPDIVSERIRKSRYFTRGWTLQEIIAPSIVIFLDGDWQEIGTKLTLKNDLNAATRIPVKFLLGADLQSASVAQRMSWASDRITTRVEDRAYSLLGLFGVNMPLLYGEGERAFARLQEEIIKTIDDYSIFAWSLGMPGTTGALSPSPEGFRDSYNIVADNSCRDLDEAITFNNKGVHLQAKILKGPLADGSALAILPCRLQGPFVGSFKEVAIHVQPLASKQFYFRRSEHGRLDFIKPQQTLGLETKRVCIEQGQQIRDHPQAQLAHAAGNGNTKVLQLLLSQGWNPDSGHYEGRSPLANAVLNGHGDAVRLLLDHGAQVHHGGPDGRKPLQLAVDIRHANLVEAILQSEIDTSLPGLEDIPMSFYTEFRRRHAGIVDALLDSGADPDEVDGRGPTVMQRAVAGGKEHVVGALLRKARLEYCPEGTFQTLLSMAAQAGKLGVVQLLLDHGANMESQDELGLTPLAHAASAGHRQVVELLLNKGADKKSMEAKVYRGQTALSRAAVVGNYPMVKLLLDRGADMESRDENGVTPLIHAVCAIWNSQVWNLLLTRGADVEARDNRGRTALSWAAGQARADVVQLLLDFGADPESTDNCGCTPLMWAAIRGCSRLSKDMGSYLQPENSPAGWIGPEYGMSFPQIIKMLLEAGANISVTNVHGLTALSLAKLSSNPLTVRDAVNLLETAPGRKGKRPSDDDEPEGQTPRKQPVLANGADAGRSHVAFCDSGRQTVNLQI